MPWKEFSVLDQRVQFLADLLAERDTMTALCARYGISRQTGYKWQARYAAAGPTGLHDQSRAPHTTPQAITPACAALLVALRDARPTWGPRKLRDFLQQVWPEHAWPAASTVGDVLTRAGRTHHRRPRPQGRATPTPHLTAPAAAYVCALDTKGWFRTGDGVPCHPVTLSELGSRYLIRCHALPAVTWATVRPLLTAAFREIGLPDVLRTDNGTPYASTGLGGLSRLSVWALHLGIRPERIRPGHPEENGRHERLHRTLQTDCTAHPAATCAAQQRALARFQTIYNTQRPHEALGGQCPAAVFTPAPRPWPAGGPRPFVYAPGAEVRRVLPNGTCKWRGHALYVSEALIGEQVAFVPLTERHVTLRVGPLAVAVWDTVTTTWGSPADATQLWHLCGEEIWRP